MGTRNEGPESSSGFGRTVLEPGSNLTDRGFFFSGMKAEPNGFRLTLPVSKKFSAIILSTSSTFVRKERALVQLLIGQFMYAIYLWE